MGDCSARTAVAVGNEAPRDVRLAAAMMIYAASDTAISEPKFPLQLSFTAYEDDYEAMTELCQMAAWRPEKFSHMQKTLSAIARKLADWHYLECFVRVRNEDAMENNEPTKWHVYTAPLKYRARLNPAAWRGYKPDWPPVDELAFMLRRMFNYEGPVAEWRTDAAAV
jgi:hypothetical protein